MKNNLDWSTHPENIITLPQKILSYLSLLIREEQFRIFRNSLKPKSNQKVLDVGVREDETLVDSNFFERRYPYPYSLTAVSVEKVNQLSKKYPSIKFQKIEVGKKLPFRNNSFDIVVSWATLEHVGTRKQQAFFLKELFRVGERVFVTTPNKNFFYEPHSGLFFLHWLPHGYFSKICGFLGKSFWSKISNLNPLSLRDIKMILPEKSKSRAFLFKSFGLFGTHIIVRK